MERFFSLGHLTTEQLCELYRDACKVGKLLIEYDKPGEDGDCRIDLPEEDILENISCEEHNYLVYHEDFEDFPDGITVAFAMTGYPFTTAYIDMNNSQLDWFAEKYGLSQWWQKEGSKNIYYPFSLFYTLEPMKRHNLN